MEKVPAIQYRLWHLLVAVAVASAVLAYIRHSRYDTQEWGAYAGTYRSVAGESVWEDVHCMLSQEGFSSQELALGEFPENSPSGMFNLLGCRQISPALRGILPDGKKCVVRGFMRKVPNNRFKVQVVVLYENARHERADSEANALASRVAKEIERCVEEEEDDLFASH